MNAEERALLAGIWSAGDETPWLILADYYQERDDLLGEFIRTWVRGSRDELLRGGVVHPDLNIDRPAMWMLLQPDLREWLADRVRTMMPYIDLHNQGLGNAPVRALATCPFLGGARELSLSYNRLTAEGIADLVQSPFMESVESLDLSWNAIHSRGAKIIAKSPRLMRLGELDLGYAAIAGQGVMALCDSPHLNEITRLNLEMNPFPRALRETVRSRFRMATCQF